MPKLIEESQETGRRKTGQKEKRSQITRDNNPLNKNEGYSERSYKMRKLSELMEKQIVFRRGLLKAKFTENELEITSPTKIECASASKNFLEEIGLIHFFVFRTLWRHLSMYDRRKVSKSSLFEVALAVNVQVK